MAFMATYPWSFNKGNDHETCNNRIGCGFRALEHIRTCTSWRRIGIGCRRNLRRLGGDRQRDGLDFKRRHDRSGGRVGNFSKQHPESVREYPRTQSLAERVNNDPHRPRFGSQQVKEKAPLLRGAFFHALSTRSTGSNVHRSKMVQRRGTFEGAIPSRSVQHIHVQLRAAVISHDSGVVPGAKPVGPYFSDRPMVSSNEAPLIRLLLIVQVANTRDVRRVAILFGPFDRLFLRFECCQRVIRMVFDDEIGDRLSFSFSFRPCFNKNVGHRIVLPFAPDLLARTARFNAGAAGKLGAPVVSRTAQAESSISFKHPPDPA